MKIHGHGHSGGPGGPDGVPPGHDIDKPGDGNDRKSFEEIMEEQQAEVIQEQIEREQEEERQRQIEEQYRQKQLLRQRDAQKGEEVIQNIDEDQQEDVALTEKDETAYQKKALSNNLEAPRFSVKQQKVGNTQITSEGSNEKPTWAPDGRHIAFESTRAGGSQIFSMILDGTKIRQLTKTGKNTKPAWSGFAKP